MSIITSPWIAIDIGADRVYAAYLDTEGMAQSVQPEHGEFDSVFHVAHNGKIRFGRDAAERLGDDPRGIVLLSSTSLKHDETIPFPDDRLPTQPTLLLTALLRRVRQYCEATLFSGIPLETCVLTLPHRSDRLRQNYSRIAWEAGFSEIHFRDMAVATETLRRNIWTETFPYITVCNLGAARISFTLLKCRSGGCERIEGFHSVGTVGIDEIDRIILYSADPGNIAPVDLFDARLQLRTLRGIYSPEKEETFEFYLNGRKKRIRSVHFETATRIFIQRMLTCFTVYSNRLLEVAGTAAIPLVLAGAGASNPLISQALENFASSEVFWWPGAEEAGALGAAMTYLPKARPETPTEDEERFFRCYESALEGNADSCYTLARMLETGNGTAVSHEEAFDWYRLAAQKGSLAGMFGLARCFFQGVGTARNPQASVPWLDESARAGYAPSQYALAMYLFKNRPESFSEADAWLRQAADQGYAEALAYLQQHPPRPPLDRAAPDAISVPNPLTDPPPTGENPFSIALSVSDNP